MPLLLYVLTDIIHLVKILFIEEMFFMFTKHSYKNNIIIYSLSCIGMIAISIGTYFSGNTLMQLLFYLLSVIGLCCILYKDKVYKIALSAIWIMFMSSLLDIMSTVLVTTIMEILNWDVLYLAETFAAIISLMIILIVGIIYKNNSKVGIKDVKTGHLIIFSGLTIAAAFVVTLMASVVEEQGTDNLLFLGALCIVVLGTFLQLAFVIILFVQRNAYKEQKQVIKKYLDEQKKHYEYLEIREKDTKKFRHDLRSHMDTMCNLVKKHEYEEFLKYFDNVNTKIKTFGNGITVHNGIADAIINQYYAIATSKGINMKVSGRFPVECPIEAYDVCTIFSNVLSNAIEAAVETEEKLVGLECRYTNENTLFIFISNSFKNVGQFANGIIKSSKADSDYHGYGIENVKDSIKKYGGFFDVKIEENIFGLKIILYY